jgi:hypothetical protein
LSVARARIRSQYCIGDRRWSASSDDDHGEGVPTLIDAMWPVWRRVPSDAPSAARARTAS